MEHIKLFDSELKLMELIWAREPVSAKEVSVLAKEAIGWNKNTTYTVIKKLIEKGVLRREEPNFICSSLVAREAVQKAETDSLIEKLYSGSRKLFLSAFLQNEKLTDEEIAELKALIDQK